MYKWRRFPTDALIWRGLTVNCPPKPEGIWLINLEERPVRFSRQAIPSPARHLPSAWSARRERCVAILTQTEFEIGDISCTTRFFSVVVIRMVGHRLPAAGTFSPRSTGLLSTLRVGEVLIAKPKDATGPPPSRRWRIVSSYPCPPLASPDRRNRLRHFEGLRR